jgi:hypothetical protein
MMTGTLSQPNSTSTLWGETFAVFSLSHDEGHSVIFVGAASLS